MPRPDVVLEKSLKQVPFMKRVRQRLKRDWARYKLRRAKSAHRRQRGRVANQQIAFVFGCQRSGTNMALRTLNRSLDVDMVEESDPRCFAHARIMGKDVQDRIIAASDAQCLIFKPICDSHRALELLGDHPGSKAIWIYRDYHDVANSAIEYWGDQTQRWLEDLLAGDGQWGIAQWNREKLTDECLAEVRDAVQDGLNPHGACCLFWYMRNRLFFEQDLANDPRVMLVRYEEVVQHPLEEFERMCRFLDVTVTEQMTANVFASSIRKRPFPEVSPRILTACDQMLARLDEARQACQR